MSSKSKVKTESTTDSITMTAALIAEELNIASDAMRNRWPGLSPDTELDVQQEERIRYWAAELALTPERRELRNLLRPLAEIRVIFYHIGPQHSHGEPLAGVLPCCLQV